MCSRTAPEVAASFSLAAMIYRILADSVLVLHLMFIAFVMSGGLLMLRWPRLLAAHLPAVCWAVLVELSGWTCPLTPLETHWRQAAGAVGYRGASSSTTCCR